MVNGEAAYGMSTQVVSGVMRIATHPKIYNNPSRFTEVNAFASVLLTQPHCQIIRPGPRHWNIFGDLCARSGATGNLVQDAWYAALAIESGCEWITADRDYARFGGLRWRTPF